MHWSEFLLRMFVPMVEILIVVTQVMATRAGTRRRGPCMDTHPDDWKCPDASELARVLGATPAARDPRPLQLFSEGHAPARPHRPDARPQVSTHPGFSEVVPAFEGLPSDHGTRRTSWESHGPCKRIRLGDPYVSRPSIQEAMAGRGWPVLIRDVKSIPTTGRARMLPSSPGFSERSHRRHWRRPCRGCPIAGTLCGIGSWTAESLFRKGERGASAPSLRRSSIAGQGADAPRSPRPAPSGTDCESLFPASLIEPPNRDGRTQPGAS